MSLNTVSRDRPPSKALGLVDALGEKPLPGA